MLDPHLHEPLRGNSSTVALSTLKYNEDIRFSYALSDSRVQLASKYIIATISLKMIWSLPCSCIAFPSYTPPSQYNTRCSEIHYIVQQGIRHSADTQSKEYMTHKPCMYYYRRAIIIALKDCESTMFVVWTSYDKNRTVLTLFTPISYPILHCSSRCHYQL